MVQRVGTWAEGAGNSLTLKQKEIDHLITLGKKMFLSNKMSTLLIFVLTTVNNANKNMSVE